MREPDADTNIARTLEDFDMTRPEFVVALLAALLVGVPTAVPRASGQDRPAWEFKAVSVGTDEKEATKKLNALAAEGWDLVGPLGNGLVAFKRAVLTAQEVAAKKELAKWEGEWSSGDQTLIIKGDRWRWGVTGKFTLEEFKDNRIKIVDVGDKVIFADLSVEEGEQKGQVCRAIFRLDGDTLRYCGSYAGRPTGFEDGSGYAVDWMRAKK
jgi:uncharacterized protein (TIGR03067 family)